MDDGVGAADVRKSELWWKLNDEMEQLCQELRRYTVFRLLPDDCYDAFFSVIREITGQFSLFPPEEHSLSEDDQTKLLSASAEEFFQSDDGDSDPEISLGLLDLFRRREGSEEKGDEDGEIAPGTLFEQLPAEWVCPECAETKDQFVKA